MCLFNNISKDNISKIYDNVDFELVQLNNLNEYVVFYLGLYHDKKLNDFGMMQYYFDIINTNDDLLLFEMGFYYLNKFYPVKSKKICDFNSYNSCDNNIDFDIAVNYLTLAANQHNVKALYWLGNINYYMLRKKDIGKKYYLDAIHFNNDETKFDIGNIFFMDEQFTIAKTYYEEALNRMKYYKNSRDYDYARNRDVIKNNLKNTIKNIKKLKFIYLILHKKLNNNVR